LEVYLFNIPMDSTRPAVVNTAMVRLHRFLGLAAELFGLEEHLA